MSVESLHQSNKHARFLRDDEKALLTAMLLAHPNWHLYQREIASRKVSEMSDGGMGSVKFIAPDARSLGVTLVEGDYLDIDGVPVSIVINADDHGSLYEVDFWKTDFSPLKQYPRPELVKIKRE
jgi:hypothetical protein